MSSTHPLLQVIFNHKNLPRWDFKATTLSTVFHLRFLKQVSTVQSNNLVHSPFPARLISEVKERGASGQ